MKKIFSTLLFLSFASAINAQVPGYMGMKFSAGYDFHFYLGGLQNTARIYDASYRIYQPSVFLNKFNEVHADYVLSKNYSLGLAYQFFKTGAFYYEDGTIPDTSGAYYSYSGKNYLNLTGSAIIVNNKFFFFKNGSALAPTGNYFQLGVGAVTVSSTSKDIVTIENGYYNDQYYALYKTHDKITTPIIALGLGNQSILFDRLIIDLGVEGAFLPGTLPAVAHGGNGDGSSYGNYPKEINARYAILTRLQTFYISSVKVGVGILLF